MMRLVSLPGFLCFLLLACALQLRPATANPPANRGPLWIGVKTTPASSVLRSQLGLPRGRGIVVRSIAPNSPAAKAGLQVNDLLLVADQQILSRPRDLLRILDRAPQDRLAIDFLRGGQKKSVVIEPLIRREAAKPTSRNPETAERPFLRNLINQVAPVIQAGISNQEHSAEDNARIIEGLLSNLPDNFQITLRRTDGKPPRFIVEQEGQRWELDGTQITRWGQALLPLAQGLLGDDSPAVAPPELDVNESEITIPQADIPLPAIELPSDLPPLRAAEESEKED